MIPQQKITYQGKIIGELRSDGLFITFRERRHFFVMYRGFGLSSSVLTDLKKKGCHTIVLIYNKEDGTQEAFKTYLNKFFECGHIWKDGEDYQRILPLKDFNMRLGSTWVTPSPLNYR